MLATGNRLDHAANSIVKNNYAEIQKNIESVVDTNTPFLPCTKFGHNLTQLRLFIEHCLIENKLHNRSLKEGDASDPCWCAWQLYLSGLNDHYNQHHYGNHTPEFPATVDEAIDDLASGWSLDLVPKLVSWYCMLDPIKTLVMSRTAISLKYKPGELPSLGQPLPASAVISHFHQPKGTELILKYETKTRTPYLDDGQTKSLVYSYRWNPTELASKQLEKLAPVLLIRWLRDSILETPIRDIATTNETNRAVDLLHEVMLIACPARSEHAYAVMRAVAKKLWPAEAIQWLLELPQMDRKIIDHAYESLKKDGLQSSDRLGALSAYRL